MDIGELRVGPTSEPAPLFEFSFLIGSTGAEETVFLDNLQIETTGRQEIDPGKYSLVASWNRAPSLPPTGPDSLKLAADIPPTGERSTARRTDTDSRELNFQLSRGEAVRVILRLPPSEPGLYSIQTTISGFEADADPFTQSGPPATFGWVRSSSGGFGSTELRKNHAAGCEASGS